MVQPIPLRGLGKLGVTPDSQGQALPIGAWDDSRNVRFAGLSMEKMLEPILEMEIPLLIDPIGAITPKWMQDWSDGLSTYVAIAVGASDGDYLLFWRRGSEADMGTWVIAGGPYPEGQWQSFDWGDTCIFNNGQAAPQVFDQGSMMFIDLPKWGVISTAADLTDNLEPSRDTGALCTVILPYKSYLVALGVTESGLYRPNTVWWSNSTPLIGLNEGVEGTGGPPDWDYESPGSLSGKSEVGAGDGALTWGHILNENLICYTEGSATAMQFVGGGFVMQFRRLFNKGCAGLHLAVEFNNQHYVLSRDQLYIHDGSTVKLIARDRVEEEFFKRAGKGGRFGGANVDWTTAFMVKNPDRKEVVLAFNERYGEVDARGALVYNFEDDNYTWMDASAEEAAPDDPNCAPYACNAMGEIEADLVWEMDQLIHVDNGGYQGSPRHRSPEKNGGIDLVAGGFQANVGGNASQSSTPCIEGACANSVYSDNGINQSALRVEFGNDSEAQGYAHGDATAASSAGCLVHMVGHSANPSRCDFITINHQVSINGGAGYQNVYAYVGSNTELRPDSLHLQMRGARFELDTYIEWATLGIDPYAPFWVHLDFTSTVSLNGSSPRAIVTAEVRINNVLVASDSQDQTGNETGYTEFIHSHLAPQYQFGDGLPNFIYGNLWFCQTGGDVFQSHAYYHKSVMTAEQRDAIAFLYSRNQLGYEPPAYCDLLATETELYPVGCMKYMFEPGWQTRWEDLDSTTWDDLDTAGTKWSDFYYHGGEQSLYWMTSRGIYRSDQTVVTDGLKNYFVLRDDIDLDDIVQQWMSHNYKYANQMFFHIEQPYKVAEGSPNNFTLQMGAKNNLMDDPSWRAPVVVNLDKTANSGKHKADFRVTGRYLAMRIEFDETGELRMSGAELMAEEAHGR